MRIIILTSCERDVASRVLPSLIENSKLNVVKIVLNHGLSPNHLKYIKRKIYKIFKIGILGALNGIRIRKWFRDNEVESLFVLCKRYNIELSESPFINCDTTKELFKDANADLGLSLGNGYIPKSVFSIPKYGMINIHIELLPEFQNAQEIIWPIYERKKETGFTIHQIDRKIDTGDILYQEKYPIIFFPTLKETVMKNRQITMTKIGKAFSFVCENYEFLKKNAIKQTNGKSYTTPTIWQFLRMIKNHRSLFKANNEATP